MSKIQTAVRVAYAKGYRIAPDGFAVSPRGNRLVLRETSRGYLGFTVVLPGVARAKRNGKVPVHKLQAFQKFGEAVFQPGVVVRHLDGNSRNNSVGNIAIGSAHDNRMDIPKSRRLELAGNANRKHDHAAILQQRANGATIKDIQRMFGISSKGTVSFIINKSMKIANATLDPQPEHGV